MYTANVYKSFLIILIITLLKNGYSDLKRSGAHRQARLTEETEDREAVQFEPPAALLGADPMYIHRRINNIQWF